MSKNKVEILWDEKFSVGVGEIDEQHKKLVEILNELVALIQEYPAGSDSDIESTIEKINEYKTFHFATEEKYFEQFNFKGAAEHIQKHRDFDQKITELVAAFQKDKSKDQLFELVDYMENWFIDHLLNTDRKYMECFKENGLK
jgi:hemerythrin-like metal-binding protein